MNRRARFARSVRKFSKAAAVATLVIAILAVVGFVVSTTVLGGLSAQASASPGAAVKPLVEKPTEPVVESLDASEGLPSSPGERALGADLQSATEDRQRTTPDTLGSGEEDAGPAPENADAEDAFARASADRSENGTGRSSRMEPQRLVGPPDAGREGGDVPVGGSGGEPKSPRIPSGETVARSPEAAAPEVPADKTLRLTVPRMDRVSGVQVANAPYDDRAALDAGALHPESTGFPWEREANVYIAGHRIGYAGTGSFLVFYDLDKLEPGDTVLVSDALGRQYEYSVTGKRVVESDETAVMEPVENENVLTLQTCTLPDYTDRLIVRAEKVSP